MTYPGSHWQFFYLPCGRNECVGYEIPNDPAKCDLHIQSWLPCLTITLNWYHFKLWQLSVSHVLDFSRDQFQSWSEWSWHLKIKTSTIQRATWFYFDITLPLLRINRQITSHPRTLILPLEVKENSASGKIHSITTRIKSSFYFTSSMYVWANNTC